jgi:hypothetical protein
MIHGGLLGQWAWHNIWDTTFRKGNRRKLGGQASDLGFGS